MLRISFFKLANHCLFESIDIERLAPFSRSVCLSQNFTTASFQIKAALVLAVLRMHASKQ